MEEAILDLDIYEGDMPDYLPSTDRRTIHSATMSIRSFSEKVDIHQEIPDYDMNTMENIVFDTYSLKPVFTEGFRLCRIPFTVPKDLKSGQLCGVRILRVAVREILAALNGEIVMKENDHGDGPMEIRFAASPG